VKDAQSMFIAIGKRVVSYLFGAAVLVVLVVARMPAGLASTSVYAARSFIAPGTQTTDDPRRIPIKPGPRGPKGSLVLRGGVVFDAVDRLTRPETVVIERDHIKAILPPDSKDFPADATVLDVSGKFVMPGLIDMHVHLTYPDRSTLPDEITSEGAGVLRGIQNAEIFAENGFTSLRDLGVVLNAPYILYEWSENICGWSHYYRYRRPRS
jgi:hypothetical protein